MRCTEADRNVDICSWSSHRFDSHFCWLSEEVFFLEPCLVPSESARLSTSDSDGRELWRPAWLDTLNRALLFRARSDSGADWLRSGSWFSGSEPTFTKAFLVLVRAEVTEPITKKRVGLINASLGIDVPEPDFTQKPVETWFHFLDGRCALKATNNTEKNKTKNKTSVPLFAF